MSNARTETGRYLRWYAREDLFSPTARNVTWILVVTLAVVYFLTVIAVSTALSLPALQQTRLEKSPFSKSLWIGQPAIQERMLSESKIKLIEEKLEQSSYAGHVPGLSGFNQLQFYFREVDADTCRRELWGRTIDPDTELAKTLMRLCGADCFESRMLVTQDLIMTLGLQPNVDVLAVKFAERDQTPVVIPVRVIPDTLPYGHYFIITENCYREYFQQACEQRASMASSGPMQRFPTIGQLKTNDQTSQLIQRFRIVEARIKPHSTSGMKQVRFRSEVMLTEANWQSFLHSLVAQIPTEYGLAPEFADVELYAPQKAHPPDFNEFDYAEVRVDVLEDLKPAAIACRAADYPADETLVQQIDIVQEISRFLFGSMILTALLVFIITLLIVVAIQNLRCKQKSEEYKMLKAMGFSRSEFFCVMWTQVWHLWLRASIGGACLTALLVFVLNLWILTKDDTLTIVPFIATTLVIETSLLFTVIAGGAFVGAGSHFTDE